MLLAGEPVELSMQSSSGHLGWLRLVPPHPYPLRLGEGTPHPALQRVEALWIGESASSDSPSPQGPGRGKQRSKHQCACELRMNSTTQAPCAPRCKAETPARRSAFDSPRSGERLSHSPRERAG